MKYLVTNVTGGRPFLDDDLTLINDNFKETLEGLARGLGLDSDAYILYGCEVSVTGSGGPNPLLNMTKGAVWLDHEIYQSAEVVNQALPANTTEAEVRDNYEWTTTFIYSNNVVFKDSTPHDTHLNKIAYLELVGTSGYTGIPRVSDLLVTPKASETVEGKAEIASTSEVQSGLDNERIVTPQGLLGVSGGILRKFIEIGDWDMDADKFKDVSHGLQLDKIINVSVLIFDDASQFKYPLDFTLISGGNPNGGVANITTTKVSMYRLDGGLFDGASFDSTSFNRGHIVIDYIV